MVTSSAQHGSARSPVANVANRTGEWTEERALFVLRQSALAPFISMWPVVVGAALWLGLNGLSLGLVGLPLPTPLQIAIFVLLLAMAIRWLIHDGLDWYSSSYTLTNTRLIILWGAFSRRRRQAPLAQIQNVRVIWPNPIANLLDIGDVEVRTAGASGDLRLAAVSQPQAIARAITEAQRATLAARHTTAPAHNGSGNGNGADMDSLTPAARAVMRVMETMDKEGQNAGTEDHDANGSDAGARMGGSLRGSLVALLPGERVVARLHRHWFVLLKKLALPLAICVLLIAAGLLLRPVLAPPIIGASWAIICVGALVGLIWGGLITLNFVDDVFILTTRRIIDIDRRFAILAEARREALYSAVQDVAVHAPPLGRLLGYGRILVETAGQSPNIEMDNIASPLETQDRIFALMRREKQRAAAKESQGNQRDLRAVVGQALSALLVSMPETRGLPVGEAVARLRRAGLAVSVLTQRSNVAGPLGYVIGQSPSAGAILVRGGEAQLIVGPRSTRPAPPAPSASPPPASARPRGPSVIPPIPPSGMATSRA